MYGAPHNSGAVLTARAAGLNGPILVGISF